MSKGSFAEPMDVTTAAVERMAESVRCHTDSATDVYLTMMDLVRDRDRLAKELQTIKGLAERSIAVWRWGDAGHWWEGSQKLKAGTFEEAVAEVVDRETKAGRPGGLSP